MTDKNRIEEVFAKQKAYKLKAALASAEQRKAKLQTLKQVVLDLATEIDQALYEDLGKPVTEEISMEVGSVVKDIDNAIDNLDQWMQPVAVNPEINDGSVKAYIKNEARGQVLIMTAWNFPFALALCPLIPAIAAGNVACVKTNEMTPATAKVTAKVIAEAFSEEFVAAFTGDVQEAIALQEMPFDHVFFTGSPAVGKSVMQMAARNLSSVTLELGGKCPAIVDENAQLESACGNIAIGRTYNLGQTCLCVDYAIVKESMLDSFVGGVKAVLEATYYDNGEYKAERNSRIIDVRNFERLKGYLDDALEKGATIAFGGKVDKASLIIEPTILTNVDPSSRILEDEIFGPILPIVTYQTREDIVNFINSKPKPLGLYVFSNNDEFIDYVLDRTSAGGVSVNGWASHYFEPALPFGGVNNSGTGSYHGEFGFKEFSHQKAVYRA